MLKHEIIAPVGGLPVFFNHYSVTNQLFPSHWHQHVEILYIVEGSMEITTGQSTYKLVDKDFFIVNSSLIHQTLVRTITEVILLQVPLTMFSQSVTDIEHHTFNAYMPYKTYKDSDMYNVMNKNLQIMLKHYQSKSTGFAFLFNSALQQLLYQIYVYGSSYNTSHPFTGNTKHLQHLKKAITYIDEHYARAISLQAISSHLALNQEYFCRMFKKNMGVTFLEYVNQVRIVHIYDDLISTDHSVTYLQALHGLTNYKVFSRMFKKSYGCTPSAIRKNKHLTSN